MMIDWRRRIFFSIHLSRSRCYADADKIVHSRTDIGSVDLLLLFGRNADEGKNKTRAWWVWPVSCAMISR